MPGGRVRKIGVAGMTGLGVRRMRRGRRR